MITSMTVMGNTCKSQSAATFDDLMGIENTDSVKPRTFHAQTRLARVIDVYDGDTVTIITKLDPSERLRTYKFRLYGLDTPEIKPKRDIPNRDIYCSSQARPR